MIGKCRLCDEEKSLQESHIIPKFIFKWLKDTSATGYLRKSNNINKRVQDGLKQPWLCTSCEQRISKWEKYFADKIFYPLVTGVEKVGYNQELLKFCVSISWRTLQYYNEISSLLHLNDELRVKMKECLLEWKNFILGNISSPGEFELHFYNFNIQIFNTNHKLPRNIHRYLQRTVHIDVIATSITALVYVKLPNFILTGYIKLPNRSEWRETRVCVNNGIIAPKEMISFPSQLWEYIMNKAEKLDLANNLLSGNQKEKIKEVYQKNITKVVDSRTFESLLKDINLSGEHEFFDHE